MAGAWRYIQLNTALRPPEGDASGAPVRALLEDIESGAPEQRTRAVESLATENADAQSRQNAATMTGSGKRSDGDEVAGDGTAMFAVRMVTNP